MKLNLGSGNERFDGFTNVDLYDKTADVMADICDLPFPDSSVDEAIAYQVIEHVPYNQSEKMFREICRVLKKGSHVTIETPDVDYICQAILVEGIQDKWMHSLVGEYYRPWDADRYEDWEHHAGSVHRNPWNFERLATIAGPFFNEIVREETNKVIDVPENMRVRLVK